MGSGAQVRSLLRGAEVPHTTQHGQKKCKKKKKRGSGKWGEQCYRKNPEFIIVVLTNEVQTLSGRQMRE